ncbi:MAG: T9SS type A sorting domain-containing protein [Bacteroidota bacterium]
MKIATLFAHFFLFVFPITAQITFQKVVGGLHEGCASAVQQSSDGGYIFAGYIGQFPRKNFLMKADSVGDTLWTKTYLDTVYNLTHAMQQTFDGGYILAGSGNLSSNIYLIKTDSNGDTVWTRSFNNISYDAEAYSVCETSDSGYMISGTFLGDIFLIKTNSNGDTLWTKGYGGWLTEYGRSIKQTNDGGYIIAGATESFGAGLTDFYLVKTDMNGNLEWSKTYGDVHYEFAISVQQTTDGGYIIGGYAGSAGINILKTDSAGTMEWSHDYVVGTESIAFSIVQTNDQGYIVTGSCTGTDGYTDVFLLKINDLGFNVWTKIYDEGDYYIPFPDPNSVWQTNDSGYIVTGFKFRFGSDTTGIYFIKTTSDGNSNCNQSNLQTLSNGWNIQENTAATIVSPTNFSVGIPAMVIGHLDSFISLCEPLGINEYSINQGDFFISPNPVSGTCTIHNTHKLQNVQVEIYNLLGEKKYAVKLNNELTTLNGELLAKGIYFVKLQLENGTTIQKLIIE